MAHELMETLKKEHDEVKNIMGKLSDGSGRSKSRQALFLKFKEELIPHMKGEEKHLYPALMEKKQARMKAMEAIEEHQAASTVLKSLDKLDMDAENWPAKMKVLKEMIEHHIEEEEEAVFEAAEDSLDEDRLDRIMDSFEKEKEKARAKL